MSLSRHLAPPTARRLLRNAGPPIGWDLAALLPGAALVALAVTPGTPRVPLLVGAIVVFALPALLDRTGWRVRLGMAWLAVEQRRRAQHLPRTPAGADRWLDRTDASEAGLTQVSVLLMAGRFDDARRALDAFEPATPEDRVRVVRMRAALDGMQRGVVDPTEAEGAIATLPAELRPYHRLSLAWSVAWVDAAARRPWRERYAAAAAGLRWSDIPIRFVLVHVLQELAVLVAGAAMIVALVVFGAL